MRGTAYYMHDMEADETRNRIENWRARKGKEPSLVNLQRWHCSKGTFKECETTIS